LLAAFAGLRKRICLPSGEKRPRLSPASEAVSATSLPPPAGTIPPAAGTIQRCEVLVFFSRSTSVAEKSTHLPSCERSMSPRRRIFIRSSKVMGRRLRRGPGSPRGRGPERRPYFCTWISLEPSVLVYWVDEGRCFPPFRKERRRMGHSPSCGGQTCMGANPLRRLVRLSIKGKSRGRESEDRLMVMGISAGLGRMRRELWVWH